ncbi:MAG: hypothetical protein K6B74_09945 [Ruminococcus sp.]|nr:hypothetical protein [Ruminococcus sp.]
MNITLKKILLAAIVIALAVFLFKYIGIILVSATALLVIILKWVLKGLVIIGGIFLLFTIFKK